ncbi:proto-oncogene tyrosine-protein kinase receptor Ret isoform X1 [Diachasmimorpha longicaudata]|uniref:proto-oncogene tyrosine-protein kinase receptor Ret isoform X1 n=1 Tax=Diachasmimorpha longicaudata TaxID=58733 RepID=UPI0030B8A333
MMVNSWRKVWLMQLSLVFTIAPTLASALYFPQSDLTLRLPYFGKNSGPTTPHISIFVLRTLRNDPAVSRDPKYQIVSENDRSVGLDARSGEISLQSLPKKGGVKTIVVEAKERGGDATIEIKLQPIEIKGERINCSEFTQDVCFWNVAKYKIYENQGSTMLGTIGPAAYGTLCPSLRVTRYELLNGTDYFHIINEELYSNASLDRDTLEPPGGPGPHVDLRVRCFLWEERTGRQYIHEKNLDVDILDEDDNPPIAQIDTNVEIELADFKAGTRLDNNELMVNDADAASSNIYSVRILGDIHNALNMTFNTMSIEHPTRPETPPYTAIFTRIFSRTTLLPKSPYRVILQVTDESLLPGRGEKSVNFTLSFVGPQHHTTSTTTPTPLDKPISFPDNIVVARTASRFARITQPFVKPLANQIFTIVNSKIFNITAKGGIIYVANETALRNASERIPLKIDWISPNRKVSTQTLVLLVVPEMTKSAVGSCFDQPGEIHSCANAATQKECEKVCGVGVGIFMNNATSSCIWRSNNRSHSITERYETCSPDRTHCPDHVCDELEYLDHRICPQDCAIEEEITFGVMNKNGRGIKEAEGVCVCTDEMKCTCGRAYRNAAGKKANSTINSVKGSSKDPRDGGKIKREREKEVEMAVSDAHKVASGSKCGTECVIGVFLAISIAIFIVTGIVACWWKNRGLRKGGRRECKHRSDDITNGLGILPLDYLDRGDGQLINIENFASINRSLLLPKNSPDPKWEFPRSQLTIEQVLGEGEFGRVLRARAVDIGDWPGHTTVAVKTLKEDASGSELADLLSEYQLLKEAQHPNVIRLLGACTTPGGPVYLIIEFAEFGSLRNYLRRSRHLESEGRVPCSTSLLSASPGNARDDVQDASTNYEITPHDILSFAWQISKGMAYLADIKLVHRDLAARNVLLATGKVCKISDFGLTRDVYEDDAYLKRSKGRVPVKWMAPESLADHVYTSKSDVWSFGVLLWELVTLGASPYPGVDVHNLYNLLKAGYRMERPANCSPQLYKLMVSCWHDEAGMRPSFKELTCQWERMLEDGVEYLDLNPRTVHNQAYFASLHALDSPNSNNDGVVSGNFNVFRTEAVNYLSKPLSEPINKCDKINKLQALWQDPICSFPNGTVKSTYVNDRPDNLNVNHYESPIRLRKVSVVSNSENDLRTPISERPQSYIDMQGKKSDQEDLLLFNGNDSNDKDDESTKKLTK